MNAIFQALSDPTRREILRLLRERDMTAGELAERFPLAKSTLSSHFNVLKNAGQTTSLSITPLDLFRFQNNVAGKDPTTTDDFTNFARALDSGGNPIFDDLTLELAMSTGRYTGDGLEASHWKDDALTGQLIGVMDPSLYSGFKESVSWNDIRALDLIGYDIVPEPGAMAVSSLLTLAMVRGRRRR